MQNNGDSYFWKLGREGKYSKWNAQDQRQFLILEVDTDK